MTHLKKEIKDEKEGSQHYRSLAKRDALNKRLYTKMAKDEAGHAKHLKAIERREHK